MKNIFLLVMAMQLLLVVKGIGQIPVDTIEISYNKTAFLIFNGNPTYMTASDMINIDTVGNKLAIYPEYRDPFEETNLLVQVGSNYHLFIVRYNENVTDLFHNYQYLTVAGDQDTVVAGVHNQVIDLVEVQNIANAKRIRDSIAGYYAGRCDTVLNTEQDIKTLGTMKYHYLAYVPNMYVDDRHFYIRYSIKNTSNIKLDVDYLSFYIRNKSGKLRKKGYEEVTINPVYTRNNILLVNGKETKDMVVVFDKFTIEKDKILSIELWEKDGDRRIIVDVDYKHLINIEPLEYSELKN